MQGIYPLYTGGRGVHLPFAIMNNIEQRRGHSVVWQISLGGSSAFGIYMFVYALVFPYIFLFVDCFKWALIDDIEQWRVHSVLWQFWVGRSICLWYLYVSICTCISLYFPISWLFWMGFHWWHWKAKCSLSFSGSLEGGFIWLWS